MIITPHKYTNISESVLGITGVIVKTLILSGSIKLTDLQERVLSDRWQNSREAFFHSLYFLYSLWKIQYLPKIDSVQLTLWD